MLAVFIAFAAQLLIAGIQHGLNREGVDFPAPILAMATVFLVFSMAGVVLPGVEDFYRKRLKRATELLNRHMSIGFTIPVVMLCHGPLADDRSVGMIIICFILTGFFNTVLAYFLALPVQCLMVRHDKEFWVDGNTDAEMGEAQRSPKLRTPAKSFCGDSLTTSSLTIGLDSSAGSSSESDEPSPRPNSTRGPKRSSRWLHLRTFAFRNPILLLFWFLTLLLGLPLRYAQHKDVPLATSLLFSTWLTTLAIQSSIKSHPSLHPWARTLLSGVSNAVLWTSLCMIAYVFADSAISGRSLGEMLETLQTHTPLSSLILHATTFSSSAPSPPSPQIQQVGKGWMASGDMAVTLLNSGLVAWGFKLYEHRAQLLSRAGLTVCTVSSLLALLNVACLPLFAHALRIEPASRALAFAARSVTIALASPVMGMLKGDGGLNAAMVVGSGIVYQIGLGLGVGRWMEGRVGGWVLRRYGLRRREDWQEVEYGTGVTAGQSENLDAGDGERETTRVRGRGGDTDTDEETRTQLREETQAPAPQTQPPTSSGDGRGGMLITAQAKARAQQRANDPLTVAAGVTVGINAAAMGTAYLYEAQSDAGPHAALSMIALGIMTVVFSSIAPLAGWIVQRVGS
ncbi:hypothetical protein VTI74DRAFT_11236 [Chaetomium olivicolor]